MKSSSIARKLLLELAALPDRSTASIRRWRHIHSKHLAAEPGAKLLAVAKGILNSADPLRRFVAYELIYHHAKALDVLSARSVRGLGRGIASWGDTDVFGCYIAGPAWRRGRLQDAEILAWTRSEDRWWRRAALVATVPLNVRAQGGTGDARRTLAVCRALLDDRDPMVVKALSWALRALVARDREAVQRFLNQHGERAAALVRREVGCKLATGRKVSTRG
jgi:hypothetical protein